MVSLRLFPWLSLVCACRDARAQENSRTTIDFWKTPRIFPPHSNEERSYYENLQAGVVFENGLTLRAELPVLLLDVAVGHAGNVVAHNLMQWLVPPFLPLDFRRGGGRVPVIIEHIRA